MSDRTTHQRTLAPRNAAARERLRERQHRPRVHRACGGGVSYVGDALDGKPRFACDKCADTWTCGFDGGEWAALIPAERPAQ